VTAPSIIRGQKRVLAGAIFQTALTSPQGPFTRRAQFVEIRTADRIRTHVVNCADARAIQPGNHARFALETDAEDVLETPLFQALYKLHRLTGDPLTCRDMLRIVVAARLACPRSSAITPSGEPESRCFCKTADRLRLLRIWRITPTRAPRNSTTGAKIWPLLSEIERRIVF